MELHEGTYWDSGPRTTRIFPGAASVFLSFVTAGEKLFEDNVIYVGLTRLLFRCVSLGRKWRIIDGRWFFASAFCETVGVMDLIGSWGFAERGGIAGMGLEVVILRMEVVLIFECL